jgi:hypothetical protein
VDDAAAQARDPGLVLGPSTETGDPAITLREAWGTHGSTAALRSLIPGPVFLHGQLAIDTLGAAGREKPTGAQYPYKDSWLIATACDGAPAGCLLVRNELTVEGQLIAREVVSASLPCGPVSLRGPSEGGAVAICHDGGVWTAWRSPDLERWSQIPLQQAGGFGSGQRVSFDSATLRLRPQGDRMPWSGPVLTLDNPGYSLFASSQQGVALSFDQATSIAFDQTSSLLYIGTRGGVFERRYRPQAPFSLDPADPQVRFTYNRSAQPDHWLTDVQRLVASPDGGVWIEYGGMARRGRLGAGGSWQPLPDGAAWPEELRQAGGGYRVMRGEAGFSHGDHALILRSHNALGLADRDLGQVVTFAFDDAQQTLWIATDHNGLIKVLPGAQEWPAGR